jgi:Tol biopolymer transport system component
MDKTQPSNKTFIGLIIGAIVLVAGLLLISNAGGGGSPTDVPSATQTRVALQPTATPESEASPIPGERRTTEEDPDGDGFVGDADFCPEVFGEFDGCPDTDGDGIGDSKDACIDRGDEGYGIDDTGCPNPPIDTDGDGVFDNDDTCPTDGDMGNGVDSVGCPIPVPSIDSDGDGILDDQDQCPNEGDMGNGIDGVGCPIMVMIPDNAPALVPYEFTGMSGMICTVTIINVGDGDPAILGEESGLTPDANGNLSGFVSILLGADDIPGEAQIGCVPDSAPAVMPYEFTGLPTEATCDVIIINIGDGDPAILGEATGLTPDGDGNLSGAIGIVLGDGDVPEAQIGCYIIDPPALAILEYQFVVTGNPICEVVIIDEGNVEVIRFPVTIGEGGIISGIYEYDLAVVPVPRAELVCDELTTIEDAVAINMGTVGECQIIEGAAVAVFTLTNPNDSDIYNGYTDQNGVAGEAYVPANGTNTINIIPNVDGFARIKFTGVSNFAEVTGCVVAPESSPEITPFPETTEIVPEETPAPELTPEATSAPELTPEVTETPTGYELDIVPVCYTEEGINFVRFDVYFDGVLPAQFDYQYASGIFAETGVLPIVVGEPVFYAKPLDEGVFTAQLVLIDGENSWTSDADCTEIFAPQFQEWLLVDIDKEWYPSFAQGEGSSALAEGYGNFAFVPDFDIPALIVVSSDFGAMICDWFATFGELECRVEFTSRPEWYPYFDKLPVAPGGSYTVIENVPDGWTTQSGVGTFTRDNCPYAYSYTEVYTNSNGDIETIEVAECDHEVVNIQDETVLGDYYGISVQKIWNDLEPTAMTMSGLNSPALGSGGTSGPKTSYYPLITVTSSMGVGNCYWSYWEWNEQEYAYLECYYDHNLDAPYHPNDYLLVPAGESYTVTEVAISGYINVSGLGTFTYDSCMASQSQTVGEDGYAFEPEIDLCTHVVVNNEFENNETFYRVELDKAWVTGEDGGGLGAPALGGSGDGPMQSIPNFITAESSIGTAVCSWEYVFYNSRLVCVYAAKDGQTMPDNTALWVPTGESYTVTETAPDNWTVVSGTGTFDEASCPNFYGGVCRHTVVNYSDAPNVYVLIVGKLWLDVLCLDEGDCYEDCEFFEDCYEECFDCTSNNGGLNAPAGGYGGFDAPGPNMYISNLITVTTDLGSMTCDWSPQYYDSYYDITFGRLDCRATSTADGYPPLYNALWASPGSSYTVTENLPQGYYTAFGTGQFSIDECIGLEPLGASAQTIGKYGYDKDECFHIVGNDKDEIIPTPEPTPDVTPEITPIITPEPTPDVTPEITPIITPEPTPDVTPEITPIITPEPTPDVTPEITEVPTEVVTPEVPIEPTEVVTPEVPTETPTEVVTEIPTEVVTPEIPVGVCGDYTTDADGFPVINLSSRFCGGGSEGQVVNFAPIETGGDVCVAESVYHSNANGTWDIFRTSADTTPENMTNAAAGVINMAPSRSPNGRYVAFVSNADGDWEIYLLDLEGESKLMQLTNNENAIDLDPVFSPSGRYLAYESNVDGNWEIRVIDLTTGEKSRVTNHPANDINPFWHPSGDKIAFQSDRTGKWQIFEATNIGGENRTRLISDGIGDDFDPTYNHAGTQIAFRSERNGEMGIYVMDDDGNNVTRISPVGYTASTPVWADGDRYIAYQASQAGTSLNDIFVYDTQTGETRQITASDGDLANAQDVAPTWLCNSLTLIFASDVSGNNRIYALPILPMTDAPVNMRDVVSWTENEFNNRDPQNTPSEENGSRMGALPPRFRP